MVVRTLCAFLTDARRARPASHWHDNGGEAFTYGRPLPPMNGAKIPPHMNQPEDGLDTHVVVPKNDVTHERRM